MRPWRSWIARQTPTLKAAGSNPVGRTKNRRKYITFGGFLNYRSSLFLRWVTDLSAPLFYLRKPPRLRHTLVQHSAAVPADQILQPVAQESVPSESHDGLFCCQSIPRSHDPQWAQWLTGSCGCFVSLLFIKSPTPPAAPDWPLSCSCRRRGYRCPAWWTVGCGPAGLPRWPRRRRRQSGGWRWCAAGSGRSG